jgi:hypothetical protein
MKFFFRHGAPIVMSASLCNIVGKALIGRPIGAAALFPFIIVRDEAILANDNYIRHESIHLRQYIETAIVGLLIIGFLQYLYARLILRKSKLDAYYFMSHEQEAHQNDTDPDYLKNRHWFSYYKYLLPRHKKRIALVDGKRVIFDD